MVDCGASKCLQERKNFKKELLSWTKKVPLLVGLEEISKVVLGRRFSKKILDVTRYGEKKHTVEDWEPQENCTFCDSKSKFYVGKEDHNTKDNKETSNDFTPENSTLSNTSQSTYPPNIANGHKDNNNIGYTVNDLSSNKGNSASMMTSDPDQPLDLTMPSKGCDSPASKPLVIPLKVPSLEGKFPSRKREGGNGQKKVYTEEELAAAVSDIRSGKIGTRRAAALYGIPRSTLRNKMCRLDMLEANNNSTSNQTPPVAASAQAPKLTVRDLLQSGNGVTYKEDSSLDGRGVNDDEGDEENKWSSIKSKHDLNAGVKRPFGMPPLFYNSQYMMECERAFQLANPYAYDMKLPYLQDLIWRYAQERIESNNPADYTTKEKDIQDYINNSRNDCNDVSNTEMTALGLQIPTLPSSAEHYVTSLNSSPSRASETQDAESPPSAQEGYITSQISDTLKDVISKTISEKMLKSRLHLNILPSPSDPQRPSSSDPMVSPPSQPVFPNPYEGFYLPPTNGFGFPNGQSHSHRSMDEPPLKKHKFDMKQLMAAHVRNITPPMKKVTENPPIAPKPADVPTNVDDKSPVKKTRPKRGQYRKYNHELLMEAVRAVQRGEMSVHRAGSYYGVPHSTLEYKVKERHLLRQKKPREPRKKNVNNVTNGGSGNEASNSNKSATTTTTTSPQVATNATDTSPSTPSSNNTNELSNHSKEADVKEENVATANVADESEIEPLNAEQLKAAQSLHASLLMNSLGASGGLPNFPLVPNFPMGFGWPPLINGNLPFPLPDAALAASLYSSASGLGINTSASELLKKLQQKVQLGTVDETDDPSDKQEEKDTSNKEVDKKEALPSTDDDSDDSEEPTTEEVPTREQVVDNESGDSNNAIEVVDK